MLGILAEFGLRLIGFCAVLIVLIVGLFILDRVMSRRRKPAYTCVVTGCGRPSEPSDGPFCPYHGWRDAR